MQSNEGEYKQLGKVCKFVLQAGFWSVLAIVLFVGLVEPASLQAQAQNGGTIAGRVLDNQGAVIPGATLSLKSLDQGRVITVQGNAQGEYVFSNVPVANYSLTVKAASFADYTVNSIQVDATASLTINATLKPGNLNATVTVEADSLTLDTRSATVGTIIDNNLVENLPLDGNNVVETAALLPGVTDVNAPTTFTSDTAGPTYNVSGARSNQNLFLLDGALWNNLYNNAGINFPPRQALQEVSVLLNNYKAQYGRDVGSVFNALTKSGGNAYHGVLWDFIQNKALNAADYISKQNPKLVQNQFGGTIGGPILRDKLFFFLAYQDLRSAAAVTAQANTPTVSERGLQADGVTPRPCATAAFAAAGYSCASFTEDAHAVANPVKSGYSATAISALNAAYQVGGGTGTSPCVTALLSQPSTLPSMEVPSICFNPVSLNLLKRFPLPTLIIPGTTLPYAVTTANQPRNDQDGLARIDFNLGHHALNARYYQTAANDQTANGVSSGLGIAGYEINSNIANIHFATLEDAWVLKSNIVNVARVAYKRYVYNIAPMDTTSLSDLGAQLSQPGHPALPRININSRFSVGSTSQNFSTSVNEDVEVDDSITYVHGKHTYQAGLQFLRLQFLRNFDQTPGINFNNNYTGIPSADFILGLPATSSFGNATNNAAVQHDVYLYAQDDWRILPRLTLNLGVRYEIPFQWYQPDGHAATFKPGYQSTIFPNAPPGVAFVGDPGVERSLIGTPFNNIAPRFGFAFDAYGDGATVVRGGFGIFYDAVNALVVGVSEPYHYSENPANNAGGLSNPLLGLTPIPLNYNKANPVFALPYSITFPDANFKTPYTESVNFGIQQKVRASGLFEANYVGRFGRHQALGVDMNPAIYDCSGPYYQSDPARYCLPAGSTVGSFITTAGYLNRVKYPNFNFGGGGVLDYMSIGKSNYNSAQVIYTMRSRKSLTTIASYTFSKSFDTSSNAASISNTAAQPDVSTNRGLSDFDTRHIFNIGFQYRPPVLHRFVRPVQAVVNGWSVSGIYNARTGHPFNISSAGDQSLLSEGPQYASFVAGGYVPLDSSRHRLDKKAEWFNTADICLPTVVASTCPSIGLGFGTIGRNKLEGPAFINTNFSVSRDFLLPGEGHRFVFRADAFNAFNTPNLGQPQATLSGTASKNTTFGTIIATAGSNGAVGTNGRRLQLSGTIFF